MDSKWELPGIPLRNPRPSNGMNDGNMIPAARQASNALNDLPPVLQGYARNARYRPGVQPLIAKGSSINSQLSSELPPLGEVGANKNQGGFNPVAFNLTAAGFNPNQGRKWVGGGGRFACARR